MALNPTTFGSPVGDELTPLSEQLSNAAGQVKDTLSDLGRTAAEKIDGSRDGAASGLDKAAASLRGAAGNLPGGEKVTHAAQATADSIATTAGYLRDHNLTRMMEDVEALVKNNPGPSLLAAGVIGFLLGRALTNND